MGKTIPIDRLSDEIKNQLEEYNQDVTQGIKILTKNSMNEFVKLTKQDAPTSHSSRSGTFKKHITSKKTYSGISGDVYTWYVKDPEYRLTHLLKNGHQTRSGGRTRPQDFITNNYNKVENDYINGIEGVVKNGC